MIDCLIDKIKALRTLEKTNEDSKFVHGTLNEARITKQEKLTLKCEKLESVMRVFFDTLNVKMPDLSEIEDEHEDTVEGGISLWDGKESSKNMGPLDGPYVNVGVRGAKTSLSHTHTNIRHTHVGTRTRFVVLSTKIFLILKRWYQLCFS